MTTSICDLAALKEKTDKIIKDNYNEYYLRDDLCNFKSTLEKIRDTPEISAETKSEIEQLISKVDKRLDDVCYSISMDPNGGMGNPYFDFLD